MTTEAIKKITISLPGNLAERLKKMNEEKRINGISKFCENAIRDGLKAYDKAQKARLMEEAVSDPDFQARCEEIQRDFAALDYSEREGSNEW
ncbi:hypothetical protein [uncultured Phascolarctobacterium sp.]|jgi:metal-responsive CopG/Arc/MetJ family transcriptional regulator|uniref:hypothetical protein n=1 Tax=uncultured Phascolarctobacterium sp. TaxID=512296 RepID=UPI0015B29B60|nr:hypothetical protein [uncultured Phascolarctobacterium sp.]